MGKHHFRMSAKTKCCIDDDFFVFYSKKTIFNFLKQNRLMNKHEKMVRKTYKNVVFFCLLSKENTRTKGYTFFVCFLQNFPQFGKVRKSKIFFWKKVSFFYNLRMSNFKTRKIPHTKKEDVEENKKNEKT